MVMDQFVTTYRKDYLWPYVRTLGFRPHPEQERLRSTSQLCSCHNLGKIPDSHNQPDSHLLLGPLAYEKEAWSRLGPMGPLLDPKLYPAKVSAPPESKVSKFNQPNVFLKKLQEKYPFIYECLRTASPDDLISRINRDRLRSTYQVDFCKMIRIFHGTTNFTIHSNLVEYPSAPYDELLKVAGLNNSPLYPDDEPVRLPGDFHRVYHLSKLSGPTIHRTGCDYITGPKEASYCVGSCNGPLSSITHGSTEYQDAISRLGHLIVRDKIHDRKEEPYGTPMYMIQTAKNDLSPTCPESIEFHFGTFFKVPLTHKNKAIRSGLISKQFFEYGLPLRSFNNNSEKYFFPPGKEPLPEITTYQATICNRTK